LESNSVEKMDLNGFIESWDWPTAI
jgi:hypothetical protein